MEYDYQMKKMVLLLFFFLQAIPVYSEYTGIRGAYSEGVRDRIMEEQSESIIEYRTESLRIRELEAHLRERDLVIEDLRIQLREKELELRERELDLKGRKKSN